jgi:hypothetical protein
MGDKGGQRDTTGDEEGARKWKLKKTIEKSARWKSGGDIPSNTCRKLPSGVPMLIQHNDNEDPKPNSSTQKQR